MNEDPTNTPINNQEQDQEQDIPKLTKVYNALKSEFDVTNLKIQTQLSKVNTQPLTFSSQIHAMKSKKFQTPN